MNMTSELLRELGLSENEVSIYLGLLPIGNAPASILGQRSKMPRTTAKFTSEMLVKKGLFQKSQKKNAAIYTIEPPEKILYLLEQKRKHIRELENRAQKVVSDLKNIYNPNLSLPTVRFYEGKEGIIKLYDEFLEMDDDMVNFEGAEEMRSLVSDYMKDYLKRRTAARKKNKSVSRIICPKTNPIKNDKDSYREVKKIDPKNFPFSCDIKVCKNRVSIFSFDKTVPVGISIDHEDIAKNFQAVFDHIWQWLK